MEDLVITFIKAVFTIACFYVSYCMVRLGFTAMRSSRDLRAAQRTFTDVRDGYLCAACDDVVDGERYGAMRLCQKCRDDDWERRGGF